MTVRRGSLPILVALTTPFLGLLAPPRAGATDDPRPGDHPAGTETCGLTPNGALIGRPLPGRAAVSNPWEGRNSLTVAFIDGDDSNGGLRERIRTAAREWEAYANLTFRFDDQAEVTDIAIQLKPTPGFPLRLYQSEIGQASRGRRPSMWLLFPVGTGEAELRRVVLHEFGHALGLIHELRRGDAAIHWNQDKVLAYYKALTAGKWSDDDIRRQVMDPITDAIRSKSPFDPSSIMAYPVPPGLADVVVGWNRELSPMDKAFINEVYPFGAMRTADLQVDAPPAAGEIRQRGEMVRFQFRVPRKGHYTITAAGPTPLLIALSGRDRIPTTGRVPASEGLGATFGADLDPTNQPPGPFAPGTYFLQVRHQRPKSDIGPFTLEVRGDAAGGPSRPGPATVPGAPRP
jgi:hypothetical protein